MKKIVTLAIIAIMLSACTNQSTVNILISNTNPTDTTNVKVHIPIENISQHINVHNIDSLILLNEMNQQVNFSVTHGNQDIEFVVPVIKARSQKNYSLNTSNTKLKENIFSFRTSSITINI